MEQIIHQHLLGVITPAAGDLGYGASATIPAPVSGALSGTLVMVSTGKGSNVLPTVSLTGGGNPGCIPGFSALVGGSGYIKPPTLTVTGGGGSGFVGRA